MACVEIQARIDKYKLILANYEDALIFLSTNPRKSYMVDTGQTKETVTVHSIPDITNTIETIEGIIARLIRQCNDDNGPTFSRAVWQ